MNKIKIGVKLIGGFLIVALIGALIGIIGITNIRTIDEADTILFEDMTVPLGQIATAAADFHQVRVQLRDMLRTDNPNQIAEHKAKVKELRDAITVQADDFEKRIISKEMREIFNKFKESRAEFGKYIEEIEKLAEQNKDEEGYAIIDGPALKVAQAEQKELEEMRDLKISGAKEKSDHNTVVANTATATMLAITVLGVILSFILGLIISLSITTPLNIIKDGMNYISEGDIQLKRIEKGAIAKIDERGDELKDMSTSMHNLLYYISEKEQIAKEIAEGNLVVNPKVASDEDDFGKSYSGMVGALNELLGQVSASIEQVSGGAGQVSAASQQLSQGAAEQASSLEEITSSITEISSQTKQNTDNAIMVNGLAKDARDKAEQGNVQMKELVTAMSDINKSADEIKKIVKAIDDIAFQINLLALNANVEAARAGKYGKGFAVVAEEVRNLAVRSANSVKETNQMVEDAIKAIGNGNHLVDITSKQLKEIVDGAAKVADIAAEVATASKEQTQGLDQISTGLGQIDQVTQQNTASAEESASASEELASQAQQLKGMITRFKLKESTAVRNNEVSNELIQKIKNELAREQAMKVDHLKIEHKTETHAKKTDSKQPVNPKDVIKLDDDNFGKF